MTSAANLDFSCDVPKSACSLGYLTILIVRPPPPPHTNLLRVIWLPLVNENLFPRHGKVPLEERAIKSNGAGENKTEL